jgi:hypothetical protein
MLIICPADEGQSRYGRINFSNTLSNTLTTGDDFIRGIFRALMLEETFESARVLSFTPG